MDFMGVIVSRRPCMHMWGYSAQFWVVGFVGGSTEFLVEVVWWGYGFREFFYGVMGVIFFWLWSYGSTVFLVGVIGSSSEGGVMVAVAAAAVVGLALTV